MLSFYFSLYASTSSNLCVPSSESMANRNQALGVVMAVVFAFESVCLEPCDIRG